MVRVVLPTCFAQEDRRWSDADRRAIDRTRLPKGNSVQSPESLVDGGVGRNVQIGYIDILDDIGGIGCLTLVSENVG